MFVRQLFGPNLGDLLGASPQNGGVNSYDGVCPLEDQHNWYKQLSHKQLSHKQLLTI